MLFTKTEKRLISRIKESNKEIVRIDINEPRATCFITAIDHGIKRVYRLFYSDLYRDYCIESSY